MIPSILLSALIITLICCILKVSEIPRKDTRFADVYTVIYSTMGYCWCLSIFNKITWYSLLISIFVGLTIFACDILYRWAKKKQEANKTVHTNVNEFIGMSGVVQKVLMSVGYEQMGIIQPEGESEIVVYFEQTLNDIKVGDTVTITAVREGKFYADKML